MCGLTRRHRDAESFKIPNDTLISPARVFSREPDDQIPNFGTNRRLAGTTWRRPSFRDQAPMPTEQRGRRDEERVPACAGQEAARRRQEQPLGRRHRRTLRLPTEDAEFVLQHDDFQFLEVV